VSNPNQPPGEQPEQDKQVIACNITEPTPTASTGALAYLQWPNRGWGNERVPLLIRSRGGRWIEKWEDMRRLGNFRHKTIPPEHPLHERLTGYSDEVLEEIRADCGRIHGRESEHVQP
jgi:hypothetical protein